MGASILDGGCRRAGPGDEKKKKMTVGKRPPPSPLTNNKGGRPRERPGSGLGDHIWPNDVMRVSKIRYGSGGPGAGAG